MEQNNPMLTSQGGPFQYPATLGTTPEPIYTQSGVVDTRSMQEAFSALLGRYVICEFLIGTCGLYTQDGVIIRVGPSWFQLYNEQTGTTTSCDIYSLKFITFFPEGVRPANMTPEQRQNYTQQITQIQQARMRPMAGVGTGGSTCPQAQVQGFIHPMLDTLQPSMPNTEPRMQTTPPPMVATRPATASRVPAEEPNIPIMVILE